MHRTTITAITALLLCVAACGDNQTPAPPRGEYQAAAPTPLPCVPNLDGKIEAKELTPALGITATYLISPSGKDRPVDVAGATNSAGQLVWSFGTDYADDATLTLAAQPLDGKWYASSFPGLVKPFVTPIDAGDLTEGVYTQDDQGIYLHGVASSKQDPPEGKTLLVYGTKVALYQFPLTPGAAWTSIGEVKNGTFRGLPYAGRDTYDVKVDGAGQLVLPDLTLTQAMRVRTLVTVAPAAGQTTTQRQVGFLFECLGEVARATSKLNEPDENFTDATELRRLGLAPLSN
jgi:hypothetical protein